MYICIYMYIYIHVHIHTYVFIYTTVAASVDCVWKQTQMTLIPLIHMTPKPQTLNPKNHNTGNPQHRTNSTFEATFHCLWTITHVFLKQSLNSSKWLRLVGSLRL